jgi:hypothetical protein
LQTRSHYVTNDLAVLRGKDCPYLSCASHAVNSSINRGCSASIGFAAIKLNRGITHVINTPDNRDPNTVC